MIIITLRPTSRSWASRRTGVRAWVRPTPMWWSRPLTRRVTLPESSMRSCRTRSWVSCSRLARGVAFGPAVLAVAGVDQCVQRAVWAAVVVLLGEGVQQHLEFGDGGRLDGLGAEPVLHRRLEAFHLPQVVGWLGREFSWVTCRRLSSCSSEVRPPRPPAKRVV